MIKYDVIKKFAAEFPDKAAIIENDTIISWGKFDKSVFYLLGNVVELEKLEKDKPVLYMSDNSSDLVLLSSVFATLGVPFQGIDHHLPIEKLTLLIETIGVKYIFVSKYLNRDLSDLNKLCKFYEVEDFVEKSLALKKTTSLENLVCMPFSSISFTSGTTGIPKVVYRTRSFDKQRFEYLQRTYGFNKEDIHLLCLPMHHVGTTGWARLFFGLGCTVVIGHFKNSYELCDILHSKKITTTLMSPLMLKGIVEALESENKTTYFSQLRFLITGGKNCSSEVKKIAISKLGSIVYEYYGTTETGINTLLSSAQFAKHPGSVGPAFEGNEILIVDDKNKPVDTGKIGKIAIFSYMNMDKYLNAPSPFVEINGRQYLVTVDYGYLNNENYLFVLQRSAQPKEQVLNLYGAESDILGLSYVSDVFIKEFFDNPKISVNIVPKKYIPFASLRQDIELISKKHHLENVTINVVPHLEYTSTGKIKL
jgi:acyl-coenzyme A synthetase/AMP-(fatty) acid ligase